MRTIEILAYSFAELSDSAKQTACDKYNDNEHFDYPWYAEVNQCREGLLAYFPGAYLDRDNDVRTGRIDDDILQLKGKRLAAWLWNNIISEVQKGHYRTMRTYNETPHKRVRREESKSTGNKWRYYRSALTFTVDCPFSGMSVDCAAMDPILDFVHGKGFSRSGSNWANTTLEDIISDCFHNISKYVDDDIEYLQSLEAFAETCESNKWEFNESGEML